MHNYHNIIADQIFDIQNKKLFFKCHLIIVLGIKLRSASGLSDILLQKCCWTEKNNNLENSDMLYT